ncbi:MAG: hypothetical protein ABFD50_06265 [Smithella sp.]
MPKSLKKDSEVTVYMTNEQKNLVQHLTSTSDKNSVSEYMLDCALNSPKDKNSDVFTLLQKQREATESFRRHQQLIMHVIMHFVMYIASFSKTKEEVKHFYEKAYRDGITEFGNGKEDANAQHK